VRGGKKAYDTDKTRDDRVMGDELNIAQAAREYAQWGVRFMTLHRHLDSKSSPSQAES
jgi:hypothetical protein